MSAQAKDSIEVWIDNLPGNQQYERENAEGIGVDLIRRGNPAKRKRDADHGQSSQALPRQKARCLVDVSGNVMKRQSPRRKENRILHPHTPSKPKKDSVLQDPDSTPKPPSSSRIPTRQDNSNEALLQETFATSSETCSQSSISSERSNRSRSPQKHLTDTLFSTIPITRIALTPTNIPQEFRSLVQDCRRISRGVGIIPEQVKANFEREGILVDQAEFESGQACPQHNLQNLERQFEDIRELWDTAKDCAERGVTEARWNGDVHYRLLRLALRDWKQEGIWWEDITSARISDKSLLASIERKAVQSKLVDLAIIIDSPKELERRIAEKLLRQYPAKSAPVQSVNCTNAHSVRFRPIAISIETKRDTCSTDPYLQLGTWTLACLLKLRQMIPTQATLPCLPVLSVTGHNWCLNFAVLRTDEYEQDRLDLITDLTLGDTKTVPGVYGLVAAIRLLARWAKEKYQPWFEETVLGT